MNDKKTVTLKNPNPVVGDGGFILVVEDEEMLRDFLQTVLEEDGYKVILAADGMEALRRYAEHRDEIDLVLLDMGLPKMSGEAVLAKLIALNPNVKVIAVSGTVELEVQESVLQNGATDFLGKPYLTEVLLSKAEYAIRG
ncbi:MAG: response regulator [Bacteroidetes bacterium]|nr:response regulator [Bacteroidota bacterium]